MQARTKRRVIATIHALMRRPKWHNETFARYNQKKLHAWAAEWHSASLKPVQPRVDRDVIPGELQMLSDRMLMRQIYQPKVMRPQLHIVAPTEGGKEGCRG